MSDVMLIGVLRMPPDLWNGTELDVNQRHSRYIEASERIEADAEKIEQLQTKLAESEATVARLESFYNSLSSHLNEYQVLSNEEWLSDWTVRKEIHETKSQSLQHVEDEAVNICTNDLISETEVINESPQHIADAAIDQYRNELKQQARTVRNFSNPKDIFVAIPVSALDVELRQQQTGSDGDE